GRVIAFTGKNGLTETDIYYVWLRAEDDESSSRDRSLEKALEKIKKAREQAANPRRGDRDSEAPGSPRNAKRPDVIIDFEHLHERVKLISLPDTAETDLYWSADGKELLFTATVDGRRGTYSVKFPDDLRPKLFMTATVSQGRWLKIGNQIVGLVNGVPTSVAISTQTGRPSGGSSTAMAGAAPAGGRPGGRAPAAPTPAPSGSEESVGTAFRFQALQAVDLP